MANEIIPADKIAAVILVIRSQKVMLDSDLARLYGVSTKVLNQAVKRNRERFPADFMFQLNAKETLSLRSQFVTLNEQVIQTKPLETLRGQHTKYRPYAFTEQGVAMLSSVLKSERAVKVNIAIMRAFVQLRQSLETNSALARKFSELEKRVGKHDHEIGAIIEAIRQLMVPAETPKREIGFHVREKSPRYRTRKKLR